MLKRVCFLLLALIVFPVSAQDETQASAWTVTLYDQTTGTITQVAPMGDVTTQATLPIPQEFDFYNYNVAVSPLGDDVAYLVSKVGDGSDPVQPTELIVYDTHTQSITTMHDLAEGMTREGINAAGTSLHFSDDGSRLVTGYYVPTGENTYNMQLVALDTATGEVINTLDSQALGLVGVDANSAYDTQVVAFQNDAATVVLRPVFVNQNFSPIVLNWNVSTNDVALAPTDMVNATDFLPSTGEALVLVYDESVDALAEGETRAEGAIFPPNTIRLLKPATGETQTIYAEDTSFINAKFVQNGEKILAFSFAGAGGILLGRDGTVLTEFENLPGDTFTYGTSEGFIYADPQQPGTFVAVNTTGSDFTPQPFYAAEGAFNAFSVQNVTTEASG